MRIRAKYVASVAALAIWLPLAAQENGGQAENGQAGAKPVPPPPQAGVLIARPQTVLLTENLPARLEASREALIQPQVGGIVQKRLFTEGAEVKAGQQLYQIDDALYLVQLQAAEAQLAQAQANKKLAQSTANRYAPLVKEKAVSRQTYDQALAEVQVAEAQIMTARAAVKQAEINVRYAKVLAPIAGFIGKSNVSEGSLVAPGSVEMAKIQQLDPMYVNITQSAADVMTMKREMLDGAFDGVNLDVEITLEDGTPYPHRGRLLFADQTVDATTGELLVRAEVPNPDRILLPGLYVRADVPRSQFKNAYLIPQGAVLRGKTDSLRVVAEDGTFSPREVKIAGSRGNQWIVTQGLQPGEMVMVDSLSLLAAGATRITPLIVDDHGKPLAPDAPQQTAAPDASAK